MENKIEHAKKIVLVVDDTPENIDLVRGLLSEAYKVKAATSGERAIQIALKFPQPDLILLDVMMPEMDGYETCKRLKDESQTKGIPIVFLSGLTSQEDKETGLNLGAINFISKPINPSDLLGIVKSTI